VVRAGLAAAAVAAGLSTLAPPEIWAQGYRVRLDSRVQRAAFRGVTLDSIPAASAVLGQNGGLETPDGFAVRCSPGGAFCFFFRPGPELAACPMMTSADLTLWGLGLRGLSLRLNGRVQADLGDDVWPGTDPAVQLIEAYAEYAWGPFTGRGGRQLLVNRLGIVGIDGGKAVGRWARYGLEAEVYGGLGLARATALPVTSPVLDPLDEFQPRRRQIVAGGAVAWSRREAEVRLDYQREVDRDSRNFVSERASLTFDLRPVPRWNLSAGADYDFANTWFGNADALLRYTAPWITLAAGARQYRPFFDLWTIWGAFSPVPYHAVNLAAWVRPLSQVELRGRWERFVFSPTETETPLVDVDHDGWRAAAGITYRPSPAWTFDAGYREEYGPGASSNGFDGFITFAPSSALTLSAYGSTLDRPLEFRFDEGSVDVVGLDAEWSPAERVRMGLGAAQYRAGRGRPDAAGFDWNQTRLTARLSLLLRSESDAVPLPRALRTRPRTGSR
jgi:hypothetical protein